VSAIYNPEADTIARIESLEMEIRNIHRRIGHAHTEQDKRVLNRQMTDLKDEIEFHRLHLD
jgi:hypothetical protein